MRSRTILDQSQRHQQLLLGASLTSVAECLFLEAGAHCLRLLGGNVLGRVGAARMMGFEELMMWWRGRKVDIVITAEAGVLEVEGRAAESFRRELVVG